MTSSKYQTQMEVKQAFSSFLNAFEHFKQANDDRLTQIEKKMSADVVTVDKVDRINQSLSDQQRMLEDMSLTMQRPSLDSKAATYASGDLRRHRAAWDQYMRKGDQSLIAQMETKALATSPNQDGGYLVTTEVENYVDRALVRLSPIRSIATVRQVSGTLFRKPITTTGAATGWVAEDDGRTETNSPVLSAIEVPTAEIYAMPAASQTLLDDSKINIEEWLAQEIQTVFAEQESLAFINGDGSNKPKGFLQETKVADASWSWGNVGYLATGADGAFASTDPSDDLIDLIYAPSQSYRTNGRWVMNRKVESELRKFKDAQDRYLWQPGNAAGEAATLMGYPITEAEDMPDISSDSFSIAFGDFERGYLIVDRTGIRVLRDPFTSKPYVLFYTTKRVGGAVQDFAAIKLLKFGTS